MKKTAKLVSVILAVLMVLTVLPFAAFAEDKTENELKLEGWTENYAYFLNFLYDDANFTSWNYVDVNKKSIEDTMAVYTAFALYDSAWRNYATNEVSVDEAKKVLLSLIEKAEYTIDDGYVDEIIAVLETAGDVNDFIQKVNKYIDNSVIASAEWGTAFDVINTAAKIGNAYQNYRSEFIERYAEVLSVQMANVYYVDMLQYVADNTEYSVLANAANALIADINSSVDTVLKEMAAQIAGDGAELGTEYLAKLALNSNAYTAVALKVYQGAVSVADFLWNTGDQYPYIDALMTTYYFQPLVADWTEAAVAAGEADKAIKAVDLLANTRTVCEELLYKLKLAENGGVIGKVKSKLYGTVYEDIEINQTAIKTISTLLNADVADYKKVVGALYIYCPVDVSVFSSGVAEYTLADGEAANVTNKYGIFTSVYSEYAKDYLKIVFLFADQIFQLKGTKDGSVTLIMDKLADDGTVEDWSFTDVALNANTKIAFNTKFTGDPYYTYNNGTTSTKVSFNDVFVPSEHPEVTVQDVIDATVDVGKDEAKSFIERIREFFEKLFAQLFGIFGKK